MRRARNDSEIGAFCAPCEILVTESKAQTGARFTAKVLMLAVFAGLGCPGGGHTAEKRDTGGGASLVDRLGKDDVLVFVGAHPDDETLLAPLLAYCADRCREVVVVSLTKGEAGRNLNREDLTRTLAQVRAAEFEAAVRKLGGTPVTYAYINGVSRAHPQGLAVLELEEPAYRRWRTQGDNDQTAEKIYARWSQEAGDPADALRELFRQKGATVVITMDPKVGCTRHSEHIAASEAARRALQAGRASTGRKASFYYLWRPPNVPADADRVLTGDLGRAGNKDYLRLANESKACYESQYGPQGSEKMTRNIGRGVEECFLQLVGN